MMFQCYFEDLQGDVFGIFTRVRMQAYVGKYGLSVAIKERGRIRTGEEDILFLSLLWHAFGLLYSRNMSPQKISLKDRKRDQ
jgi:hypothetical protein